MATAGLSLALDSPPARADTSWPPGLDCPSLGCPYRSPSSAEAGFAIDDLARINLERESPTRNYQMGGQTVTLPPLTEDPELTQTAQAAAEFLAAQQSLSDYGGGFPGQEEAAGGNAAGPSNDSAVTHLALMESPGHAGAELSAEPDFAGVGVACDARGGAWVIELFANANRTGAEAGQARLQAELASDGIPQTENGLTFTGFPTQPIIAGEQNVYATGADWTCSGPTYAPGSAPISPLPTPVVGIAATPDGNGYWLANAAGAISIHGDAAFHGSMNSRPLSAPVVHIIATSDGGGYWLVAADGGVFAFGDASFYGSMGGSALNAPVVDLAPTPDGRGYWLVAADGGVFAFGDAAFRGSLPQLLGPHEHLVAPVVGLTALNGGYALVAADGGVFSFDAPFFGSVGGQRLVAPVLGITTAPGGSGYWLAASDGGVFAFGDASFEGSMGGRQLASPIVGIAGDAAGPGYWLAGADGGVFAFDAPFAGSD